MVRAVTALSIIVRMVRRSCGGGAGAMVVVVMGVFLVMEMEAAWLPVATAEVCGKRGQSRAHTKEEGKRQNDEKSRHV